MAGFRNPTERNTPSLVRIAKHDIRHLLSTLRKSPTEFFIKRPCLFCVCLPNTTQNNTQRTPHVFVFTVRKVANFYIFH